MPPQERETLEPRPARQLRLSEVYAKEKKKKRKTTKQAKPIQVAVEDENDDECGMCGVGGDLVCCEGCPKAFHPKCVDLDPKNLPEGDWYCRECVAKTGKVEPAEPQEEETETEEEDAVVVDEVVVEARSARTEATPSSYELERQRRIQANREKMSALVLGAKTAIMKKANEHKDRMAVARRAKYLKRLQRGAEKPRQQKVKSSARPNTRQKTKMIRTSRRLRGEQAPETEEDQFKFEQLSYEYDETERDSRMILSSDVRGKDTKEEKAKIKKLMERRCDNRGRGSVYDSKVRTNGRERERESGPRLRVPATARVKEEGLTRFLFSFFFSHARARSGRHHVPLLPPEEALRGGGLPQVLHEERHQGVHREERLLSLPLCDGNVLPGLPADQVRPGAGGREGEDGQGGVAVPPLLRGGPPE